MESARPKRVYFVSKQLLDVLLWDAREQLKIIMAGLKVRARVCVCVSIDLPSCVCTV